MTLFAAILAYALLVGCLYRSAWLRTNLTTWSSNAAMGGQLLAISTARNIRTFAITLLVMTMAFVIALIAAVALGNPLFLFIVLITGATLAFTAMYALYLVHGGINTAAAKLQDVGTRIWDNTPILLLPLKLAGGILLMIGNEAAMPLANAAKWMAGVMAGVTIPLLLLSGLALLDLQMGWTMVNSFTLMIAGLICMTIVSMQVMQKIRPNSFTSLLGIAAVLVLLFGLASNYIALKNASAFVNIYVWDPVIGICVFLQLLAIWLVMQKGDEEVTTGKHQVRQVLGLVIGSFLVWGVFYPWMTSDRPDYHWTQRFVRSQYGRLNATNTRKTEKETEPLVAAAEKAEELPTSEERMKTFMPSANRARDLQQERLAWDARAAGQDESVISTEVPVYQDDWAAMPNDSVTRTVREVRVPTLVTVTGKVRPEFYPSHQAGPDGKSWDPAKHKHDRTVLMEERHLDQPTEQTGNLNEAIARFCQDKDGMDCGPGFAVGSQAVLCVGPGLHNGGFLQARYNGLQMINGVVMHLYFSGTEKSSGKFKFVITPDYPEKGQTFAADVCAQHPGVLVVKLPRAESLVATNGGK